MFDKISQESTEKSHTDIAITDNKMQYLRPDSTNGPEFEGWVFFVV